MDNKNTKSQFKTYHVITRVFAGLGFFVGMLVTGYAILDVILSEVDVIATLSRTFTILIMFYFTWCLLYTAKTGLNPLKTMPFSINEKSQL